MKITVTEEMRACLRMIREADDERVKLSHDFAAAFACYTAQATGAIDLARLVAEAVERIEEEKAREKREAEAERARRAEIERRNAAECGTTHPSPKAFCVPTSDGPVVVKVIAADGGLVIHRAVLDDDGFNVAHKRSGLVLTRHESEEGARATMSRLLEAGDWDRPAEEIMKEGNMADTVRSVRRELLDAAAARHAEGGGGDA